MSVWLDAFEILIPVWWRYSAACDNICRFSVQYLVFPIIFKILRGLALMKNAAIIHCDLKPENILLGTSVMPEVKIVDFGSACMEEQTVFSYIQFCCGAVTIDHLKLSLVISILSNEVDVFANEIIFILKNHFYPFYSNHSSVPNELRPCRVVTFFKQVLRCLFYYLTNVF